MQVLQITQLVLQTLQDKGDHRLQITLTLEKKDIGSTDDSSFVELINIKNGIVQSEDRNTEYVLGDTLARENF